MLHLNRASGALKSLLVAVVSAVGALLCAYLVGFFLPILEGEGPQKSCSLDPTRPDWLAFIGLLFLDIYVSPNVLSLALSVALLARLCAERRSSILVGTAHSNTIDDMRIDWNEVQ